MYRLDPLAVALIGFGALALLVFVILTVVVIQSRRWTRERRRYSRALNQALTMVDDARGMALDQTRLIVWADRRDEQTRPVDQAETLVLRLR
jgi:hypothetical protein